MASSPDEIVEALRDSLIENERLRRQHDNLMTSLSEPVAIVGMACRFPGGVRDPEGLWDLVASGTDAISGFPGNRGWAETGQLDGTSYVPAGGFVYDADEFDEGFFGISPREALAMDPQQRLMLEVSWEALEHAGINAQVLRGTKTGVFAGATFSGYGSDLAGSESAGYLLTGGMTAVISGRVSYALGLEGPAVTVDTACSSSLTALHLACQELRAGECTLALAGGVTVMATPAAFAEFARQQGLAADGRCKAFGAGADGIGWGEGAGVLVLERLSDAQRHGRQVLAVIRGSAVNQDGASNGLTAPNGPSQQRLIRAALAGAQLTAADVDAVEAHGTGTTLGDPLEAQAILATYGQDRDRPLWLGSVKSNIGHTSAAAGAAGVIKVVLALQHQELPRTLFADEPSPHVDWSAGDVRLLTRPVPWPPEDERRRRAGVSAFGISGTNVHVIVEEAPEPQVRPAPARGAGAPVGDGAPDAVLGAGTGPAAWLVSGRSAAALAGQAARLAAWANGPGADAAPADVAWSLAVTRSVFEHRAVVVGAGRAELAAGLSAVAAGEPVAGVSAGAVPAGGTGKKMFVFPGQGGQWAGMGLELSAASPVFAARLAQCSAVLEPLTGWRVEEVLGDAAALERVDVVQPALWAVMVSLAAVWEASGVIPDAVVGHSQGEIAAAVVAGILSLEDAAKVVALRSKALTALSGRGAMASVAEPAEAVRKRLAAYGGQLSVAVVNGPEATVVSGDPGAVADLAAACERDAVRVRVLPVDYASHGPQVEELEEQILAALDGIAPQPGRIPMISAMTGQWTDGPELDARYWYQSLRAPVEFDRSVGVLAEDGYRAFVEVSPHPVLTGAVAASLERAGHPPALVTGTLRRDDGGAGRLLTSLAAAHVAGLTVDWAAVLPPARPVPLPTYAFQRQHYWPKGSATVSQLAVAGNGAGGADEARFWAAVDGGDVARLADALGVDGRRPFEEVIPALSNWRRRERERTEIASWRYRVTWAPFATAAPATLRGTWLLVVPAERGDGELADWCAAALAAGGARVIRVRVDALAAGRAELAARISQALAGGEPSDVPPGEAAEAPGGEDVPTVAGVLSLLALRTEPVPGYPQVAAGLAGTLGLVQGLGYADIQAPLWVLTRGAVAAVPGEAPDPVQAGVWGLGRVVGLEHPDRWGGLIDLPPVAGELVLDEPVFDGPVPDERAGARLRALLADCGEDQAAIRPAGIVVRRLVRAGLPGGRPGRALSGSVLVTGAGGSIGPDLAGWLAARGVPRLVLTGRRGPSTPGTASMAADLAGAGTAVVVAVCDLTDRAQTAGLMAWIKTAGPPLTAVIHAALSVTLQPVDATGLAELQLAMGAKTAGAEVLGELTEAAGLEAFVMFSSIAATWGVRDHATYAAANAYLDALAENRRARGLPATSVAWGVWDSGDRFDPSQAALMPQTLDRTRLTRQGMRLFEPERALAALGQVLDDDETALAVVDVDWERFSAVYTAARRWRLLDEIDEARPPALVGPVTGGELATRLSGLDQAERERAVTDLVCAHAAAVLGHAPDTDVEPDRAFRDMGFDSLTAVELRDRVNAASGLALPSTVVFDYPSPVALAREITARLSGNAEAASQRPPVPVFAAAPGEPVAIVGMSCRFPGGVTSPEQLWELLAAGGDVIGAFPADRGWDLAGLVNPDPDHPGTSYASEGGFVAGAGEFDAGFFGISPREALAMDPQQRLLLETAWEAVERAGIDPATLRGTVTGVFAGAAASGYAASAAGALAGAEGHLITGNVTSVISGRVSYVLGLEGPAVTVDTACSSALVAVHLACQALRAGECSSALAGGVMVIADPAEFVGFSRQRALAADGRCKAFSADADGMGLAEGAGMIMLERLSEANRHGHPVLAVITGSAVNSDGASNGLTAPNGPSQQRVIAAALAAARLSADQVDAVEAHGTGTTLGDPIEAQALIAAYGQHRDRPLWLGSVKSNIGHAQQAAGIAGLVKMVLALQHGLLPPTLHAEEPTPHVDWSAGEVRLLTEPVTWPANGTPRRAGVSAFGISGTNAHLILEDPPALYDSAGPGSCPEAGAPARDPDRALPVLDGGSGTHAWLVSAKTAPGLAAQASRLAEWAASRPGLDPADVGWSLATTRSVFDYRAVVLGSGHGELSAGLAAVSAGQPSGQVVSGAVPPRWAGKVAFVFPGQGGQWAGMGAELAAASPVFAARLAQCSAALAPHTGWRVEDVLAGPVLSGTARVFRDRGAPGLGQVDVVQPVLWAVMVALAAVWEAAGVVPDAVAGHSQGEIAAAVVAGILTLEDAATVVALRSRALTALAGRGAMASVAESADAVRERLSGWEGRVSVAAVNGPDATVVSGDPDAVAALAAVCESDGVRARVLPVDYASHGPQVEALEAEITAALAGIVPGRARVPMVSAMTGELLDGPELDAGYWYASLRAPVEFARSVRTLAADGHRVFIEVSPHPVLTTGITAVLDADDDDGASASAPAVTGTLRRDDGGPARLLASLAGAYVAGVPVDWASVLPAAGRVELPTYAFQRQHYWPRAVPVAGTGAGPDVANTEAEARFWAALEGGQLQELAADLGVDAQRPFREVLPALASWRRRARAESAAAGWRYQVTWVPVPDPGPAALAGTWLLAVPAGKVADELATGCAAALAAHGARVVTVQAGPEGTGRQELAALVRNALAVAGPGEGGPAEVVPMDGVAGVLSLLALDEAPLAGFPMVPGLAATVGLVQALGDAGIAAPLWAVTCGAVAAGPGEPLASPVQAQVWGLGRVAALEHPDRWGGLADLPPVLDGASAARLCMLLAGCGEDQVAVRAAGILGRRLTRAPQPRAARAWAPSGAVLVTGGSGAVGGHVARWLASRDAREVILASRSGPAAPGAAALAAGLAAAGTAVQVTACDSASRGELAGLLDRAAAGGLPVTAVFHAAGVGHGGMVDAVTAEDLAYVLAAKAGGGACLDELTSGTPLEAFVLFSSGAAIWGSAMTGGYAAANAYLDALAASRRSRGLAATSVAWGLWGGGGMAEGKAGAQLTRLGLREMDPAPAIAALAQVLDGGEDQVTVADIDWERFAPVFSVHRPSPLLASLPDAASVPAAGGANDGAAMPGNTRLARELAGQPAARQQEILTGLVCAQAAAVLGHSSPRAVEPARPFKDLGFDSVTAVDLRNQLATATGLTLPATLVYDHPTPAAAAQFLRGELLGIRAEAGPATLSAAGDEPIAIVGLGCRLPGGVTTPEELWDLVDTGTDAIAGFPRDRGWQTDGPYGRGLDSATAGRGGFVYDAAEFDPGFFGISPREALAMDPQQRLLLETTWEALERAGLDPRALRGSRTGVFAGAAFSGYGFGIPDSGTEGYQLTGSATAAISGRISYTLGLEGPAVTVDTACSSSLVALHLACQALRADECTMALAGGVAVMATPAGFAEFSKQGGLAVDGRCKAFGAGADGIGWSEGAGVLVLERLSDARKNGHRVLALVAGSAVNQDGASNGLTAPNGPSQQRVIRAALASARLTPGDVDAVEAHGTGTVLGDPIEAQAVIAAYGQDRPENRPLWLGSVKSNIGHAQTAAGIVGVMKMVLALQHQELPRTLHADEPSPHVDWSAGQVRLLTQPVPWPASTTPGVGAGLRRAGVSAFGISGTNAHVIIEEAPAAIPPPGTPPAETTSDGARPLAVGPVAWLVSGQSAAALAGQAARLGSWAAGPGADSAPGDVAWSLAATRSVFEHRAVVTGGDREELLAGLAAVAAGRPGPGVVSGRVRPGGPVRTGFLFSGQGSQRAGMAAGIYAASPVFAATFDRACGILEGLLEVPVAEVALGRGPDGEADARADQTLYAQPALFAVQAGLVALLAAAGVTPGAVAGHSVGEVAAAYAAGVLSLEDACALVAARARLMQGLPEGGAMAAIAAPEAEVIAVLADTGQVSIAAVNGPAAVVVSGDEDAVRRVAEEFAGRGVRTRMLRVSHAFHSARMDPVLGELGEAAARLAHAVPEVPWAGALAGALVTVPEPGYWAAAARRPVRFAGAVVALAAQGIEVFLEIGPDGTLSALGPAVVEAEDGPDDAPGGTFVPVLRKETGAAQAVTAALAAAHVAGVTVDWTRMLPAGQRVDLPTYAFQHQRYWPTTAAAAANGAVAGGDGAGSASEARFWAAVDGGHLRELAAVLEIDEARPFNQVLPVLAEWRRRERGERASTSWRYVVSWVPAADPGPGALSGTWLVVSPERASEPAGDLAVWCTPALTGRGATVVSVRAGGETGREELAALIRAAMGEGDGAGPVAGVVSLLALDEAPLPGVPGVAAGLAGTAGLVQALSDVGLAAPLWVLTQGGVAAVPGDTVGSTAQGQVWGLGRVAALELPELWGGLVDVPPVLDERAGSLLCGVLAGCGEDQAAVRPAGVFGRRLVRASAASATDRWVPSGAVLVTGGTGAIGGHVARWLASRGARKVVLTSRSGPAAAGVTALAAELAGAGTAVEVTACDSGDGSDISGLVARLAVGIPPLTAVFHAAGMAFAGTVLETSPAALAVALAAKAGGAAALDGATAGLDLEAFVLFSSGAAIWGSAVQAGYATANAYLDALAENRHARGLPATSISWGLWGGGGMGSGEAGAYLMRLGLREMDPASTMHLLAQVLDSGQRMATVADIDWDQFASVFTLRRPSPLISALPEVAQALAAAAESGGGSGDGELARQLAALPERERQPMLTGLVQAETAAILGHPSADAVEADRPFSDLGMDSLTAVELRTRLSAVTGLRLPATMIFDYPTPRALAAYLLAKSGLQEVTQSPVFDVLDELKATVSRIASDDADHPEVVARIEAMLRELRDPGKEADDGEDIRAATNDEMFELIEKEFNI